MSSHLMIRVFISVLHVSLLVNLAGCQTTPFDEFGGVSVANQAPSIPENTQKSYTTKIRLEKLSQDGNFNEGSFARDAGSFYSSALTGFIIVENVQSTEPETNIIEVTYVVRYSYPTLRNSISGDDATIKSRIGNIEAVRTGLNAQTGILAVYNVLDDEQTFSFSGSSVCGSATCNGTYVTCIETTDGITATCVSECKNGYCYGEGICFHTDANAVPTCKCENLPDLWIIGARCETKFPLWLVVLLAVIGFLILLIVIVAVILCVRRKRKKQRRKQELLNSVPKSYQNQTFVSDEIRNPRAAPRTAVPPAANHAVNALAREDSFETVTSSELPPSEYRPRTLPSRRSHASSAHSSLYHHHSRPHDTGERHHHRRGHRRRSSYESSRIPDSRRSREVRSESASEHKRPPGSETSSSETDTDDKDVKNLSFFEVEVNDLDLETDAASSVVASNSSKSSPIRWLPPKNDQPRPGWVPSLGPMMYDLPTSERRAANATTSLPRRREGGTDV